VLSRFFKKTEETPPLIREENESHLIVGSAESLKKTSFVISFGKSSSRVLGGALSTEEGGERNGAIKGGL